MSRLRIRGRGQAQSRTRGQIRFAGGRIEDSRSCYYCGRPDHFARDCYHKRADIVQGKRPSGNYSKETRREDDEEESTFIIALASNVKSYEGWFIDSGATHHMTTKNDWFVSLCPHTLSDTVELGDYSTLNIKGKGTLL